VISADAKTDGEDVQTNFLVAIETLLKDGFLYAQDPLVLWGESMGLVSKKGYVFDVAMCLEIEGKLFVLDAMADAGYRPLPPAATPAVSYIHACSLLRSHAPSPVPRSDVYDGVRSLPKRASLEEMVQTLPWFPVGAVLSSMLSSSLGAHQRFVSSLPARQAKFLKMIHSKIGHKKKDCETHHSICPIIPFDRLQLISKIGGGAFGEVWRAKFGGRVDVAVKKLLSTDPELEKEILQEAALLDKIRHPCVIEFMGISRDADTKALLVVTELMAGGSLLHWLSKQWAAVDREKLVIARDLCVGLAYVHLIGVVHRDVAARNVLLSGTDPVRVKLCDFGLGSESTFQKTEEKKYPISVPWAAPEAIKKYRFSPASDVWSYACTVYELYGECIPLYEDWGNVSPFSRNVSGFVAELEKGRRLAKPRTCPNQIYEALLKCWEFEPENRCTLDFVLDIIDGELAEEKDEEWCDLDQSDAGYCETGSYIEV
jgi:hypothetical protein